MDVPITVGVLLTLGVSFVETVLMGRDAYFDAAVSLLFLLAAQCALYAAYRQIFGVPEESVDLAKR